MEQLAIQAQTNTQGAVCIWVCIFVVIMVAVGWTGIRKLRAFNKKHNIITYDFNKVNIQDDDDDYTIYQ